MERPRSAIGRPEFSVRPSAQGQGSVNTPIPRLQAEQLPSEHVALHLAQNDLDVTPRYRNAGLPGECLGRVITRPRRKAVTSAALPRQSEPRRSFPCHENRRVIVPGRPPVVCRTALVGRELNHTFWASIRLRRTKRLQPTPECCNWGTGEVAGPAGHV
jgi:hypothetical protein